MADQDRTVVNLTDSQIAKASWVRIALTPEQRAELSASVGHDVDEIEIPVKSGTEVSARLIFKKDLVPW